jgi:hypothetical protein
MHVFHKREKGFEFETKTKKDKWNKETKGR